MHVAYRTPRGARTEADVSPAARIEGARLKRIGFGLLADETLRSLGFEVEERDG